MSDMTVTFVILGITIVMFIWGRFSLDVIALSSLLALYLADIIDVEQALSGFSNSTVILIAALFIVGDGLTRTGVTAWVGSKLMGASRGSPLRLLVLAMIGAAALSGVVSNTATVAALIPAVVMAAFGVRSTPSAFLIPLAFASSVGGLLTLTGTAPNIVITEALDAANFRPFGYFEFAWIGLPLVVITILYMVLIGRRLLPARVRGPAVNLSQEMDQLADAYSLGGELYRLRVRVGSPLAGSTLRETDFGRRFGASVLEIHPAPSNSALEQWLPGPVRDRLEKLRREPVSLPDPDQRIDHHAVVIVRGTAEAIQRLEVELMLGVLPIDDSGRGLADLLSQEIGIAEVLLTPRSSYIGTFVADGGIAERGLIVLGIRRGDKLLPNSEPLQSGDALLIRGTWDAIGHLATEPRNFVVVGRPEVLARQVSQLNRSSIVALGTLAGMVVLMVSGTVPVVIAALLAAGSMTVGRCVTTTQAYRAVSWPAVVLIGAMIPMAVALETTGGAKWVADGLVETVGGAGPTFVLAGIMLVALASSQVISNTATAVLLSPIVIITAAELGVDPHPLMMGLAVACSTAFLAPIATAPNILVMVPGDYRFRDFPRVGAPLSALFLITGIALIPVIWPF